MWRVIFLALVAVPTLFLISTQKTDALFCIKGQERCVKNFTDSFYSRNENTTGYATNKGASNAAPNWAQISSGDVGRFCLGGVCTPFQPELIQNTVETGAVKKKRGDADIYTTWGDVNFDIRGHEQIKSYEWGTYRYIPTKEIPADWSRWWYVYVANPNAFEFTSDYPCGFRKDLITEAKTVLGKQARYAPGKRPTQTLSVTDAKAPARYNWHTDYLHTAQGVSLCVLRAKKADQTIYDFRAIVEPKWPDAPSITTFTANDTVGTPETKNAVWISSGEPVRLDWDTRGATYVTPSSDEPDHIPFNISEESKYRYYGYIQNLYPKVDTRYTLKAGNAGGTSKKDIDVRIGKPFVRAFTANGRPNDISVFAGQPVTFTWDTESTEGVKVIGLSNNLNKKIESAISGEVAGFKPLLSGNYELKPWNRQWGYGDGVSIFVAVKYYDPVKAAECHAKALWIGGSLGVTVAGNWGLLSRLLKDTEYSGAGGLSGIGVGLIAGTVGYVATFSLCYAADIDVTPEILHSITGAFLKAAQSSQEPFAIEPPQGPPSETFECPPNICNPTAPPPIVKRPPPPPPDQPQLVGPIIVGVGSGDPFADWIQTIAQEGSFHKNRDKVFKSSIKVEGYDRVNELPPQYMLSRESAKYIKGHCGANGLSRTCIRNDVKAVLGVEITEEQFDRMFRSLNIFAGQQL